MSEYKKRWGDRRDARWVREVDGMHAIMPHLMPKRTDAEVYLAARMDVTEALAYLQKKNEGEEEYRATLFHCFIMAVAKTVYLRPLLNRYISGRRVYERDKITLGFVVKKRFEDHSEESLMVTEALEDWTLTEVTKKVVGKVHTVRGQDSFGLDNTLDPAEKTAPARHDAGHVGLPYPGFLRENAKGPDGRGHQLLHRGPEQPGLHPVSGGVPPSKQLRQ